MSLDELERAIATLTDDEKARLLQALARQFGDEFPGIENRPGVSGGEPCILRTRIPVWVLEQARRLGTSDAELLKIYPTLRGSDLAHAWAYVRANRGAIDQQIRENEAA